MGQNEILFKILYVRGLNDNRTEYDEPQIPLTSVKLKIQIC